MCISKILTYLCAIKQETKIKTIFENVAKVLIEHEENCLVINGKQSVKLKSCSISFKN